MNDTILPAKVSPSREYEKCKVIEMVQDGVGYAEIMSTVNITATRLHRILRMKDVIETITSSNAIVKAETARKAARLIHSAMNAVTIAVEKGDVKAALGVLMQTKALESSGCDIGFEAAKQEVATAAIQVVVNVSGHKDTVDAEVSEPVD